MSYLSIWQIIVKGIYRTRRVLLYIKAPQTTKDSNKLTILQAISQWIHRKCAYSLRNANIRVYCNMVLADLNLRHQIIFSLNKDTPMSCDIQKSHHNIYSQVRQGYIAFIAFESYQSKTEGSRYCSRIDGKGFSNKIMSAMTISYISILFCAYLSG